MDLYNSNIYKNEFFEQHIFFSITININKYLNLEMSINPKNLGGGFQGISPTQIVNGYKNSEDALTRTCLRRAWNTKYATGTVNNRTSATTPFRAVYNLGDFLSRKNYVCGGSNQVNADRPGWKSRIGSIISSCDTTGVPA